MDLRIYQVKNNLSNATLAERIGITKTYLSSISTGYLRPSGVVISKIIDVTEGEVTADTFFRKQIDKWKKDLPPDPPPSPAPNLSTINGATHD
jgi:transcriptional regulator with XRE-family HTH domain